MNINISNQNNSLRNDMAKYALTLMVSCGLGSLSAEAPATTQATIVFQKLIDNHQPRPDKADLNSADEFLEVACAAVEGDNVVFRALNDGFRTGYDSIWTIKADASGLRKVLSKKRLAPGGVGAFSDFGSNYGGDYTTSPLLRGGRIVFLGHDSNSDPTLRGIGGLYSVPLSGRPIKRIANYNTTNPSAGGFKFGQFTGFSGQVCHNGYAFDGDTVFFTAATLGNSNPAGVYRAKFDGSELAVVRDNNDPDISFTWQPANFYAPTLGVSAKSGKALFGYAGANVFGTQALYSGRQHVLLHTGSLPGDPSATPGVPGFNYFLFDGGKAIFQASAGDPYYGIFSKFGATGTLRKIVSNLSKLPGISQCPINNIGNFAADAGRVFFFASTSNCDGQTANGRTGIFMAQNGKITRIVGTDDDLGDGAVAIRVFDELGPNSVNGKRLVFRAQTTLNTGALYLANLP